MKKRTNEEQKMVLSVASIYSNMYIKAQSSLSVAGPTNFCDLTLKYNDIFYHLEAKHSNKHNNPNYCKQMLAECLYNRKKHTPKNPSSEYGLLLDCDSNVTSELLDYIRGNYHKDDWFTFGETFRCTAVFLYDTVNKKLYFMKWKDVFKTNKKPKQI